MTVNKFRLFNYIPSISVMDWYIASELIPPFLFGVGAFSSVGIAIGALFDLARKLADSGLSITIAFQIIMLKMPQFIVYAFPMSTLLAALIAYNRLSSDSELIALRSSGVSIYRLVIPAITLSLFVSGMTFVFNELIVPTTNYQATVTLEKALHQDKPLVQENNIFYPEYRDITQPNGEKSKVLSRLFYAQKFDGQSMKGLTILDWSQENLNQIVTSESAIWNQKDSMWDFTNGTIYLISPDASYRNILRFGHQQLQLPRTPLDIVSNAKDYNEMNIVESYTYLKNISLSGDDKKIRKLRIRINQKFAFPFACLVFGLLGGALGTLPKKTAKATSFGISVVIILVFYSLLTFSDVMGQIGILSPLMSAWFPNIFGLSAGGFLLIRTAQ